jgi:hypothetical protein
VVWNDVVVVRELFMADCAYSFLLGDLPLQKFPHFSWGSEFSISSRVMRILDALYAYPHYYRLAFFSDRLPSTAEQGSMDGAVFIAAQSHCLTSVVSLNPKWVVKVQFCNSRFR